MPRSLDVFLHAVIDYAGLFPPARLPLATALANYAAYRTGAHRRMLARFVCPAGLVGELDSFAADLFRADEPPWRFSVLGSSGPDAETFARSLLADVEAMRRLITAHRGRALADAMETKFPEAVVAHGAAAAIRALVRDAGESLQPLSAHLDGRPVQLFFEFPFVGDWRKNIRAIVEAIALFNADGAGAPRFNPVGAKIRTGGVQAAMIPSVEQVAFFLHACREHGVPFKATAGLHHPFRHGTSELDVPAKMHGFINVFAAAALAHVHALAEETLCNVLTDESVASFAFDDAGLQWRDFRVTCEQIACARRDLAISFGSCSFTEPIEDLQRLRLLKTTE